MILKLFINLLILSFGFLLFVQLLERNNKISFVEGFDQTDPSTATATTTTSIPTTPTPSSSKTYQDYDKNKDPMILGEQNAGNIEFLKKQIEDIPALKTTLDSLLKRMDQLEEQMNNLTIQQNKAFQDLSGGSPPPPTTGLD